MSLANLLETFPQQTIPAGYQIFHQGDECGQYFIITHGKARIFTRSSNGKEVTLYHVEPGGICVLTTACLIGDKLFPAEALAETELMVRVFSKAQFESLLEESSEFRQMVFNGFGERMNGLIEMIQKLALETIEQRMSKYLLKQPNSYIEMTHQELATEIGSAREVVSRQLKKFEDKQLVELGRGKVKILNRAGLFDLT